MSFFTAPSAGAEWIVAGLGNPEPKYEGTRHNAGFAALDDLAARWGCTLNKSKWQGLYGMAEVDGRKVLLLKPLTYMNLPGQSIAPPANFYKIKPDHVIVLCDDIAQKPAHVRIRPSGSAGGHNGLKNIAALLNTQAYARLRLGIGNDFPRGGQIDYVLGKFPPEQLQRMPALMDQAVEIIHSFCLAGVQITMNQYNHK